MEARIQWVEDAQFVAESGSGHAVVIDGPSEGGGRNMGMRPMEMVLMGVGAVRPTMSYTSSRSRDSRWSAASRSCVRNAPTGNPRYLPKFTSIS